MFQRQLKYKVAQSRDSKEYYRVYQQVRPHAALGEADSVDGAVGQPVDEDLTRFCSFLLLSTSNVFYLRKYLK